MVGVNKKTCAEEEKKVAAEEPKRRMTPLCYSLQIAVL